MAESEDARTVARDGGQQRRRRPHFVKVLEDRQGLPVQAMAVLEELEETARLALMLHGQSIRYLSEPEIDELRRMKP